MQEVVDHYHHGALEASILEALKKAGIDIDNLKPEDLGPVDEFHIKGRAATKDMAEKLSLNANTKVLDIGCGIGGASRHLASEYGCTVQGIDLSEEYCSLAHSLSSRMHLDHKVSYLHGNALDLPFESNSFDLVWSQHASMNISDKKQMLKEACRVLKPGGCLALYDILSNAEKELHYPVPWASLSTQNFLITGTNLHSLLDSTGFRLDSWKDCSEESLKWYEEIIQKAKGSAPPQLGLHLLLKEVFPEMVANQIRNLQEDRIVIVQTIAHKLSEV